MSKAVTETFAAQSTDAAPIGHNNPPAYDVTRIFARALKDQLDSEKSGVSATGRAALTCLAYYDQTHGGKSEVDTMWKMSTFLAGSDFYEAKRRSELLANLYKELKINAPKREDTSTNKSDEFAAQEREYQRKTKLLQRGLELACALVQPDGVGAPGYHASTAYSWFDEKMGTFVVPYERMLKRHQTPHGIMFDRVRGNEKQKIAANEDFRIALDAVWSADKQETGTQWSAFNADGTIDYFKANTKRLFDCSETKRVKQVKQPPVNTSTGKPQPAVKDEKVGGGSLRNKPAKTGAGNAAPAGNGGRAPGGSQSETKVGSDTVKATFEDTLKYVHSILSEPPARLEGRNYWSNDPLRTVIDETIDLLKAHKDRLVRYEAIDTAQKEKAFHAGAAAENAGSGKRLAN